jgi:hypothetical protein
MVYHSEQRCFNPALQIQYHCLNYAQYGNKAGLITDLMPTIGYQASDDLGLIPPLIY